jgi:hypothetical protein
MLAPSVERRLGVKSGDAVRFLALVYYLAVRGSTAGTSNLPEKAKP